ncbi:MAG: hypothetical protein M3Z11_02045 [Candidatus Dormibacteraeota bacterium]|nr:hypothetical protein [Candidatus Dormibacteraeota bacterium]
MKMIRGIPIVAASAILLTGCATTAGSPTSTARTSGYVLYARNAQLGSAPLDVIDAATGRTERSLPIGTPSADWSRIYSLAHGVKRTTLRAIDSKDGKLLVQISLDGDYVLPLIDAWGLTGGLSPNGQWLVAQSTGLRDRTDFMLVSTGFSQYPRRISIPGDFSFDAISNDGQRLFLIESLAATQPGHYRVRRYDVALGALHPQVIVDKREIQSASMTGTRISGVFAPDGGWQYSLYVNEKTGPFIHALNLDQTFAWCIDLPAGGDRMQQMMWSLAIAADGSALYAVNPALGKVARVDISSDGPHNEVSKVNSFAPVHPPSQASGFFTDAIAKGVQIGYAALARDGKTLVAIADAGTIAIQLADLKPSKTLINDEGVESVVMANDGAALFASSWFESTLRQIDPISGAATSTQHLKTTYVLYRAERR